MGEDQTTWKPPEPADRQLSPADQAVPAGWSRLQRLLFRFVLVFFVFHMIPFPIPELATLLSGLSVDFLGSGPQSGMQAFVKEWVSDPYEKAMDKAVLWTGEQVFGVEITYRPLGSGDTTFNYVQEFLLVVIAGAVTLLWSLAALV